MDFQEAILRLNRYWADQGCLIWQPHNVQVGAGTMNPATVLRVLGPEPWNVAYVEPTVRPADGRYGENPNRWQQYYQYQVILKPDPGNPQELYLDSLRALGIDTAVHDVRFVEDNWESPALGAWGLGWEVWLNGQEISQYTYFQQAGGLDMDPVSVEITYGMERVVMVLQGVRSLQDIRWAGDLTYGQLLLQGEIEHCTYNFEVADVDRLHQMYDLNEAEAKNALARGLVMPAHDYVLKCSHLFNVLDARGAVGVTERARYFLRMRELARQVAAAFLAQREEAGFPFMSAVQVPGTSASGTTRVPGTSENQVPGTLGEEVTAPFTLEIGCEELPVGDIEIAIAGLRRGLTRALADARLEHGELRVLATPRRLVALVDGLSVRQRDQETVVRGPAVNIAYDDDGQPTRAAQGFARSRGVAVEDLEQREIEGKAYVVAVVVEEGRAADAVLAEVLPEVIGGLRFPQSMRWNESRFPFSRPLRWIVALLGDRVIPFAVAGVDSGRRSRGARPAGSPPMEIVEASTYEQQMAAAGIVLDPQERIAAILEQARNLAQGVGGELLDDPEVSNTIGVDVSSSLLREVANLVEYPLALRGDFEEEYLRLPDVVLLAVMHKHQRYLPIVRRGANARGAGVHTRNGDANARGAGVPTRDSGQLLPHFIAVASGRDLDIDAVRHGNEEVLRARYADAAYFYDADTQQTLDAFTSQLDTLTFQERLGSVLDKVHRLQKLAPELAEVLGLDAEQAQMATRAASLAKSDLATQLVVEFTSLQGQMGRHYATLSGEPEAVAQAIEEHYLPRFAGDRLPESDEALVVGIADRIDTLVGLFGVGIQPSGAADPWGLRRAALGLIQMLVEKERSLALPVALSLAADLLPQEESDGEPVPLADEDTLRDVLAFITQRLRGYLLERGFRHDLVDAVLNERGFDPYLAYRTLQDLARWVARDDWDELLDTYARCVRITRDQERTHGVDPERMVEPATRALYEAYEQAQVQVASEQSADALFTALVALQPAIRRFFDEVLVMDKDMDLRRNRLGLLQAISALAYGIVDLTVMEGF